MACRHNEAEKVQFLVIITLAKESKANLERKHEKSRKQRLRRFGLLFHYNEEKGNHPFPSLPLSLAHSASVAGSVLAGGACYFRC